MPLQTELQRPLQKAFNWIKEQMQMHPGQPVSELIDEASRRFSLSPLDGEFLHRVLKPAKPQ